MAYDSLKSLVRQYINTNAENEITGQILQNVLITMIDELGAEYSIEGIATPTTNPGSLSGKAMYFASQAGTYTYFDGATLPLGIHLLVYNGTSWSHQTFFAVDATPTSGSSNFISSGAVFDAFKNDGGAYDVSVHFPTGGVNGGNTYDLADAIAKVPSNMRKGGMSIKFVQSSDNYYVRYNLLADSFTTDTTKWAIDNAGVYVENPEFIGVITDKNDKILFAIEKDGNVIFGCGVPKQVIDYVNSKIESLSLDEYEDIVAFLGELINNDKTLADLLDEKVDKEEGKALSTNDYDNTAKELVDMNSLISNPEFLEIKLDKYGKLLEAIKNNGTKVFPAGVDVGSATVKSIYNPEFIDVELDNNGKILFAIKTDGSIYFGAGVPQQIIDYIQQKIDELSLDEYNDIVTFLGDLINDSTLQDLLDKKVDGDYISNPEFVIAFVDENDKLLFAIKKDGDFYFEAGVPTQIQELLNTFKATLPSFENIQIQKSSFINSELDTVNNAISIPILSDTLTLINVSDETELNAAINSYSTNSIYVKLTQDIFLSGQKSITGSNKELVIDGNGHTIYQKQQDIVISGYENGMPYTNMAFNINTGCVSDGKLYKFKKTKYYEAVGRITDDNGNTFDELNDGTEAGERRFELPDELSNLQILSTDNVYINLSCWFVTYTCKVTKIENGYLYFDYGGGYNIDGDYYFGKKYTTFCFINLHPISNSLYHRNGKLYLPFSGNSFTCLDVTAFNMTDNEGIVKFINCKFKGISNACIHSKRTKVILDSCEFEGYRHYCIETTSYNNIWDNTETAEPPLRKSEIHIQSCIFKNMENGAVNSEIETICTVNDSIFTYLGESRSNKSAIAAKGIYSIKNNNFLNNGSIGISIGIVSMNTYHECRGIVENNIIELDSKYNEIAKYLTMDNGAIYIATNNDDTIVRYNRIINHSGRYANRGIFCDDGAYNIKIYSNIIDNAKGRSIEARYATGRPTAGQTDNINKIIAQNIVSGSILIEGRNMPNNGCCLGYNIYTSFPLNYVYKDVQSIETQIYGSNTYIVNGQCKSNYSLDVWRLQY